MVKAVAVLCMGGRKIAPAQRFLMAITELAGQFDDEIGQMSGRGTRTDGKRMSDEGERIVGHSVVPGGLRLIDQRPRQGIGAAAMRRHSMRQNGSRALRVARVPQQAVQAQHGCVTPRSHRHRTLERHHGGIAVSRSLERHPHPMMVVGEGGPADLLPPILDGDPVEVALLFD